MKQTIMLADKAGLRKLANGRSVSKYNDKDLAEINRKAGEALKERLSKKEELTDEEKANIIREKYNGSK